MRDGDTDTFTLRVNISAAPPPDLTPSFSGTGTSRTATVGTSFSYSRPNASGGDGTLTYAVSPSFRRGFVRQRYRRQWGTVLNRSGAIHVDGHGCGRRYRYLYTDRHHQRRAAPT